VEDEVLGEHHKDEPAGPGDRRSPLSHVVTAARDLLGVDVSFVSRVVRAGDLRDDDPRGGGTTESAPDGVVILPLASADGRLFGSLACSSRHELDERDVTYLRLLGMAIGAYVERSDSDRGKRRRDAAESGIQALLAAVEARDAYTGEHSRGVVELSMRVARELNLAEHDVEQVRQAALLHDVGKVGIPDHVLQKPGPLDPSEMDVVRRHAALGAQIVASVVELAHLAPAVRSGHERWDGHGYPDGLAGEEIPLVSRITFACDAYDAMISDRPYRSALPPKEAAAELRANAGSQFCPTSASALLAVLDRPPAFGRAQTGVRIDAGTP
jgi:putative nucleotidyltransferase with HDIG domain